MAENVTCPECEARLALPVLPVGQPVQCPRCAHVFEPRPVAAPLPGPRVVEIAEEVPSETVSPQPPPSLDGAWKAPAAMIALAVFLLVCLLEIYIHHQQYVLIQRDLQERAEFRLRARDLRFLNKMRFRVEVDDGWDNWNKLHDAAKLLAFWAIWPAAFLFLLWLNQASRNAWRLRADGLQFSPAATLSFLIPLLNFVWPYCMVQEIWRSSHPDATRDPRTWKETPASIPVRLWWGSFLAALLIGVLYLRIGSDFHERHDDGDAAVLGCLNYGIVAIGLGLMIYIINAIRLRQNARHERLLVEWEEQRSFPREREE